MPFIHVGTVLVLSSMKCWNKFWVGSGEGASAVPVKNGIGYRLTLNAFR